MFFHQRRTLGNETAPMDEPFLTGANTSGETLEQMRADQQIRIYRVNSLGGGKEGGGDERRSGADPEIPEMRGWGWVYTLKTADAISVDGERCRSEILGDLGPCPPKNVSDFTL